MPNGKNGRKNLWLWNPCPNPGWRLTAGRGPGSVPNTRGPPPTPPFIRAGGIPLLVLENVRPPPAASAPRPPPPPPERWAQAESGPAIRPATRTSAAPSAIGAVFTVTPPPHSVDVQSVLAFTGCRQGCDLRKNLATGSK